MVVGEYAGGKDCPLPNLANLRLESARLRSLRAWCRGGPKTKRYLVRRARALRCQIRYNPKSTRGMVVQMAWRTKRTPMATRMCSMSSAMTMASRGSMPIGRIPTIGGTSTIRWCLSSATLFSSRPASAGLSFSSPAAPTSRRTCGPPRLTCLRVTHIFRRAATLPPIK